MNYVFSLGDMIIVADVFAFACFGGYLGFAAGRSIILFIEAISKKLSWHKPQA